MASAPKSLVLGAGRRQGIGLVDEQHPVECPLDRPVGLQRGVTDVLTDQPGPIDLDQVALLQQPDRAVHLGEQPGDGGLAGARVAEEDEVLAGRHIGETVLVALRLDLEERDQGPDLLLDRVESDERVEIGLDFGELAGWRHPTGRQRSEAFFHPTIGLSLDLLAGLLQSLADLVGTPHHSSDASGNARDSR